MLHEGRSTYGGFNDVIARPGGGWILSGKEGQLHLFSHEGIGIKRFATGKIRRLVGWLDREHILWQSDDGKLWCGRLGNNYSKRCIEDRIWSWVSRLDQSRLLLPLIQQLKLKKYQVRFYVRAKILNQFTLIL